MPNSRIRRRVETVELATITTSFRTLAVDVELPRRGEASQRFMVPVAYFFKDPIAPDLEVEDGTGATIVIPTKRQNLALTAEALEKVVPLLGATALGGRDKQLLWRLTCGEPIVSLIAWDLMRRRHRFSPRLHALLEQLRWRWMLWVPIEGAPGSEHRIVIRRTEQIDTDELFPLIRIRGEKRAPAPFRRFRVRGRVKTSFRRPAPMAIAKRLLQYFGMVPLRYEHHVHEARRFASHHTCIPAPAGFVVRDVRVIVPDESREAEGEDEPIKRARNRPSLTSQGVGGQLAHLHAGLRKNPPKMDLHVIFGLVGRTTSIWTGAVLLTAVLLWYFNHEATVVGDLGSEDVQLAGTILLLGPPLAAGWAVRTRAAELVEHFANGARSLLLTAAVVSVFAALSLTPVPNPLGWDRTHSIAVYASIAYAAAVPISLGWLTTSRAVWFIYRALCTPARNLGVIGLLALSTIIAAVYSPLDRPGYGLLLVFSGLGLALVGLNPVGAARVDKRGFYPLVGFIAGCVALVAAGSWLGCYGPPGGAATVRDALVVVMASTFAVVVVDLIVRAVRLAR